jgi:hypothetical protein
VGGSHLAAPANRRSLSGWLTISPPLGNRGPPYSSARRVSRQQSGRGAILKQSVFEKKGVDRCLFIEFCAHME